MLRAFACGYTALAVLSGWAWVRPAVAMSRRRVLRTARLFLQVLIHLSGRDRAFADCGGDAFDRAVADIACGEYAGHAGL
jgi:hypothetical protein